MARPSDAGSLTVHPQRLFYRVTTETQRPAPQPLLPARGAKEGISIFEGKLVRLRQYEREDASLAQPLLNNWQVRRTLNPENPKPYSLWEEDRFTGGQSTVQKEFNFAIERLSDNVYVGGCGINELAWISRVATVGIFIGQPYWNSGYGTDALRTLVRFCFEQMNLQKVELHVHADNARAIRCYEKVGFVQEGRLRRHVFVEGDYIDQVSMGILREEFWAMRPQVEEER